MLKGLMSWMALEGAGIWGGWRFLTCILMEVYRRIYELYALQAQIYSEALCIGSWPLTSSHTKSNKALRYVLCVDGSVAIVQDEQRGNDE